MFSSSKIAVAGIVAVVAGLVSAAPNPTEPSSSSVFNIGSTCTVKWDADAAGTWTKMNIELMSGDNWNMIHITTVAQNIDATDATNNTFTYTCPEVTPTSPIYFYQFSDPSDPTNLLWTTRWTMAGANGDITPAAETTQPNGDKIPWGKGALVDPSTAVAAPSYLGNSQSGGTSAAATSTGSVATSAAVSASSVSSVVSSAASSAVASASSSSAATATPSITKSITSASRSATGTASASAASSTASANAALGGAAPGMMAVVGALFAAVGMF